MAKHFVLDSSITPLSKEVHEIIHLGSVERVKSASKGKQEINQQFLGVVDDLKHLEGRIVVKCDTQAKNWHTFEDGTVIRRERQFNEFNRRITEPVNTTVISADGIPEGSELLVSHNALHDTNRIFNYTPLSGKSQATDIRYFSIPEYECFAWRDGTGQMQPVKGFQFGLRVFEPYKGVLTGIDPEIIKDVLYVTTGDLKGLVCHMGKSSDYELIYQGQDGREKSLIRFRHSDTEELEREEVMAISHSLTERVLNGELLLGIEIKDAKPLKRDVPIL